MKKYYPVDFDEKGNAVLGNAKSNPTSNGFIPTTWVPGGGSEDEGNGIKSISISPAVSTTPALESVFPIYYEDLTEEQKQSGVSVEVVGILPEDFTYTITPTADWYAVCTSATTPIIGEKGTPINVPGGDNTIHLTMANGLNHEAPDFKAFMAEFSVR